jgi:hypothetical protein
MGVFAQRPEKGYFIQSDLLMGAKSYVIMSFQQFEFLVGQPQKTENIAR